jgi:hypothetical protein
MSSAERKGVDGLHRLAQARGQQKEATGKFS